MFYHLEGNNLPLLCCLTLHVYLRKSKGFQTVILILKNDLSVSNEGPV